MPPRPPGRVLDAPLAELAAVVHELGGKRVLVITGPSQRFVDRVTLALSGFEVEVFAGARRHVPGELLAQAQASLARFGADTLVSVGGGAATGLAKALRLDHDVRFVALPTTSSGSEYTTLFGVTEAGHKRTGRDPKVRPDVVLRDATLTRDMPLGLTVSSLLNALAHPLATLDTSSASASMQVEQAVRRLIEALEVLLVDPTSLEAREQAFAASELGARTIESGVPGTHHALVHALGGALDLEHSVLHSVLLPHSVGALRRSRPAAVAELEHAVDLVDLEGSLFDFLARARLPTALADLSIPFDALAAASEKLAPEGRALLRDAFLGRRPSAHTRREAWGVDEEVSVSGPELRDARRVVLSLHGRGSNADAVLRAAREIAGDDPGITFVAPQAPLGRWYAGRHHDQRQSLEPALSQSLATLKAVARRILDAVPAERLVIFGFSQGACLALELAVELGLQLGAVVALSGARIGISGERPAVPPSLAGTPVLLGKSEADPWIAAAELEPVALELTRGGCAVTVANVPGDGHSIHAQHRVRARPLFRGACSPETAGGFGAFHESEDLPGALPRHQNSPAAVGYGLVAEQVNATGFTVPRAENSRSWLYRVRPSAQQSQHDLVEHPTLSSDFDARAPEIDLSGFAPLPLPDTPTDFVDGLKTIGGAGSPRLRRGFAIHAYVANRSMEQRAFSSADGSLLCVPELGTLTLLTELGVLTVAPGSVALIPRGLRFSVLLEGATARGTLAEVFGRSFALPERGPVGANGLTDARHFRAPSAWHEDRLSPGFSLLTKFGGRLYRAAQDYSPFDAVAWHGNYAPYVYDLSCFSPASNARFDHIDPSVYTVLSATLDEAGSNNLDFVVFVPRWDPTEHTFRPPYFHRNATSEFNGIIATSGRGVFQPGSYFLTPALVPHGIVAKNVPHSRPRIEPAPAKPVENSLWFQFETTLPVSLTAWAAGASNRLENWRGVWGGYRSRFRTAP